jgi:hypothetical protein
MGFLDGFASIMQTFAVTKIASGSLLILLSQVRSFTLFAHSLYSMYRSIRLTAPDLSAILQAAIPISMLISRVLLKASYSRMQVCHSRQVVRVVKCLFRRR